MIQENYILLLPRKIKLLISVFLIVLSIGYLSGLAFVKNTTNANKQGIIENYNGNEANENATEMKFKKSDHEILNIVHTHILSMSIIFFILAFLVYGAALESRMKSILMIEPLFSVLFTFGGIYMVWLGYENMSILVMISGFLMTISFLLSVLVIFLSLIKPNENRP